jgi:hypothetical protein
MSVLTLDISASNGTSRGRTMKFTPERMEQIRNLVERGTSREQIAELIGVTVGSLQVTCSRAGISLRPPKQENRMLPKFAPVNGKPPRVASLPRLVASEPPSDGNVMKTTLILKLEAHGHERQFSVPMPSELFGRVALTAELQGKRFSDLVVATMTDCLVNLAGADMAKSELRDRIDRLEANNERLRLLIGKMERLIRDTAQNGKLDRAAADAVLAEMLAATAEEGKS